MALGALVVAHVVATFGPLAPPPSNDMNDDWHDFFRLDGNRLYNSTSALIAVIPYTWQVCMQGMRQEASRVWDDWTRLPPCPLALGNDLTICNLNIIGQDQAVSIVVDAIHTWNQDSPLVSLFLGTVGTDKEEFARQIGQQLVSGEKCTDGVIEVDALEQENHDLLVHSIVMHAVRHGSTGAVVIIQHLDVMSTRHVVQMLKSLQHYEKLILVGITGIGTRAIHSHLKEYGSIEKIRKLPLEMEMRDEVDNHFDEPVETYIHGMVPFAPIGQVQLEEILQLSIQQISQPLEGIRWKSLVLTKQLAAALVSPSQVEYIEWKDKTTRETVLVFSATGAQVLDPIRN
jgi:hypothetical protein